ncbi:MAG: transposase family protein [Chloroflexi bacterium]|uniref:H repeat-associated protein N-terminal domain-containing protein n=1 Tax=Candidatus Thermofonsia Clade 3 bacterium TaxID=2364212 RepID=A0A2M8QA45_9CHLR|nr:MAG: hypothetical protein CUN48_12605 [Candidatus Thermofonsia Clade 3 bacterium]RMG64874.1 MAG: transposase family protein [Chloroflexota bacterium]
MLGYAWSGVYPAVCAMPLVTLAHMIRKIACLSILASGPQAYASGAAPGRPQGGPRANASYQHEGEIRSNSSADSSIHAHFSILVDRRVERTRRHKLIAIPVIALSAVICGAERFTDGKAEEAWFRTFLELPNGIPLHDTFGACRHCSSRRSSRPDSWTGCAIKFRCVCPGGWLMH